MNVVNAALTSDFSASQAVQRIAAQQETLLASISPLAVTARRFDEDDFCVRGFLKRPGPARVSPKRLNRLVATTPVRRNPFDRTRLWTTAESVALTKDISRSAVRYVSVHQDNFGTSSEIEILDYVEWAILENAGSGGLVNVDTANGLIHFKLLPPPLLAGGYRVFFKHPVLPVSRDHLSSVEEILVMAENSHSALALMEENTNIHENSLEPWAATLHDFKELITLSSFPRTLRQIACQCARAVYETAKMLEIQDEKVDEVIIALSLLRGFVVAHCDEIDFFMEFYRQLPDTLTADPQFNTTLAAHLQQHLGSHHPITPWFAGCTGI